MRIPTHGHPREILRARFLRLTSSPSDDLFYSVIFSHAVWSAVGMILSSVSQSVCLWRSVLWLKDTAQVSEQVTRKWPLWTRFYNFQLLHRPYPPNSHPQNLDILLIYYTALSWSRDYFVYVATDHPASSTPLEKNRSRVPVSMADPALLCMQYKQASIIALLARVYKLRTCVTSSEL